MAAATKRVHYTNPSLVIHHRVVFFFSSFALLLSAMTSAQQLSTTFYDGTCPKALSIINQGVIFAVKKEARMGASLLRLHFHDCFVNGCDGSILLDDTSSFTGEKTAPPNNGSIRGYEVIDDIKTQLESACPDIVSCADIVAVAARDSVVQLGGPTWDVPLGRRDSTTANNVNAVINNIPRPAFNLSQLISSFSNKGFSLREMVALSGGHTIGYARCTTFRNHIYNDSNINPAFASTLKATCPRSGGDNNLAPLDNNIAHSFDNSYFKKLKSQNGVLHSDQELFNGGRADSIVSTYSSNPSAFATDFANAMLKMSQLSPLAGKNGEIRKKCRMINTS